VPNPGIPTPPRRRTPPLEPGSIAYPQATWTSFDRYDRYVEIARLVRSSLGPGRHRVLDVGDTAGYLALLEPELVVVGVDLALEAERLDGSRPMLADGSRLPFADDTFDAVVSSDVLEHVLPDRRDAFLAELRRVSRQLVVVAAPFATPGVAGAEGTIISFAQLVDKDGKAMGNPGQGAPTLGMNWVSNPDLIPFRVA
jgi:SAM-dependent methyltransferase